ncbi:MAG: SulP family inorganic anion transporter, partial [Acidimicrobiaceae bacterium]|nr:SulP family inorganic anion transporter [Acidimicrobiaceae bacterium]
MKIAGVSPKRGSVVTTAQGNDPRSLTRVSRPSNGDLIAGVSVALVAIPQSLAYAELAGLPPQYGLYATALPALLAALFVSSRYLQTGPVALTALLTLGALSSVAVPGGPDYIQSAALLALLVGLMRLLLGVVRAGRVAYVLSEPVVTGFTAGAAVVIMASQLPKIFDVDTEGQVFTAALRALESPSKWSWTAIAFAAATVALMIGGRYVHRLFPGVLVAVIAGVLVSGFGGYEGSKVGDLDSGFIPLTLNFPWSEAPSLLLPAAVIALVGFAEPAAIARTYAAADRLPWNANREMVS